MFKNFLKIRKNKDQSVSGSSGFTAYKYFSKVHDGNASVYEIAKGIPEIKNPNIKAIQVQKISNLLQKASLADLINYMKSNNEIVRSLSAQVFSVYDSPNLLSCIDNMLDDSSENLRIAAVEALNNLVSPDSLKIYHKAVLDESSQVRLKAVVGLADIASFYSSDEAIEVLNSLIDDDNTEIREFVIDELGLTGNKNSLVKLMAAMEQSSSRERELISESVNLLLSKAFAE